MEKFDVIIVGGSVSGAPTATWLARKGHRVLVVDRAQFPRDTNSTHFVWPRGVSYLNRLGVVDELLEKTPHFTKLEVNIEGVRLHGKVPLQRLRDRFNRLHGSDDGVVDFYMGPRRFFLDDVLLNAARKAGAVVKERTNISELIYAENTVCGVRGFDDTGSPFEAHADIVIGADGRMSTFANHVGARKITVRERSTFAFYGYFEGIEKDELAIHKRGRLGTAIFPTQDNRHLVLVYGPTAWWGDFSADAEANFFKTYEFVAPDVARLIKQAKRVEPFKSMGRMVAFHRENWGPGWALIGDAGSFKDQWTAMGITHSLRDAELISSYIDSVLRGRIEWNLAMREYSEKRMTDYEEYWNFVCDGAECNPYSKEQLQYFFALSRNADSVDQFMARVGDTVSFGEPILVDELRPTDYPDEIRNYDPERRGYHENIYEREAQSV